MTQNMKGKIMHLATGGPPIGEGHTFGALGEPKKVAFSATLTNGHARFREVRLRHALPA